MLNNKIALCIKSGHFDNIGKKWFNLKMSMQVKYFMNTNNFNECLKLAELLTL